MINSLKQDDLAKAFDTIHTGIDDVDISPEHEKRRIKAILAEVQIRLAAQLLPPDERRSRSFDDFLQTQNIGGVDQAILNVKAAITVLNQPKGKEHLLGLSEGDLVDFASRYAEEVRRRFFAHYSEASTDSQRDAASVHHLLSLVLPHLESADADTGTEEAPRYQEEIDLLRRVEAGGSPRAAEEELLRYMRKRKLEEPTT